MIWVGTRTAHAGERSIGAAGTSLRRNACSETEKIRDIGPKRAMDKPRNTQRGAAAAKVAQNCILLYRGFVIRWPRWDRTISPRPQPSRMQFGDTADCKSALPPSAPPPKHLREKMKLSQMEIRNTRNELRITAPARCDTGVAAGRWRRHRNKVASCWSTSRWPGSPRRRSGQFGRCRPGATGRRCCR